MNRIAIIAGQGALASALASDLDNPLVYALDGFVPEGLSAQPFRLERLVPFLDHLIDEGVSRVVFAGAIRRPRLEPELFDMRTAQLVPRIMMAMQSGDDAALRAVIDVFEEHGVNVCSISDIASHMIPGAGFLTGAASDADKRDVERGVRILTALGPLDVGQGVVVAQGQCMAVETLPGTDAMLEFVAQHAGLRPNPKGARGVFYKAPKPGQDRRIDLPVIGPETIARAAAAGLAGIAFEAGGVILLHRAESVRLAVEKGLFLWSRPVSD